ncbi:DUF6265 family protein [Adhaeribacter radiodurans]|uniref:DUF6265 domain-containing protein n=1 Tax=Adhaeribacter radiodurans TaxID=2745197 RepID=A0A7L7LEW7_9BACT|nr:DUF6265 family protein [Adhaeribacter radiodurans]QMU30929.1 hypothetical protein HUW48_24180 [Adhaeribacter radiodurans]
MKRIFVLLLVFVFAGLLPHVYGQTQPKGGSVADVSFIQGNWKATAADGRTIDGVWLAPENGNILGFMRMMKDGKANLYEILAYEQTSNGLVSLVKHFQPGLVGTEEKDKQDRYNFVEASKDRAIFQKEGEDLRILYEKRSPTQFVIARGNQENGKWVFKDLFVFNRAK